MSTTSAAECERYRPRNPREETLHRVLLEHLETFLSRIEESPWLPPLPTWVERELRGQLTCGILAAGFCRVFCPSCGSDLLVPFSCKGRGFCPSCGGRRMAEVSAHLIDNVFPEVPVRQWVISFPWTLRYLLAVDSQLCREVRRICLRAIFSFYSRKAREGGVLGGRTGAVVQLQRFGSALNANLHMHMLVLDGVFNAPDTHTTPSLHRARPICDAEVAKLLFTIRSRVLRHCHRRGLLTEFQELAPAHEESEQSLLPLLCAASVQGRVALGPASGTSIARLGRPVVDGASKAVVIKQLCAELDGFTLHAAVRVDGARDRDRLEHLCRYVTRPALSSKRLSLDEQGRVILHLRVPFRDGTTHFVFEPLAFIERLAALVPPPRVHQLTYHGVLAPAASWRDRIVPGAKRERREGAADDSRPCFRYTWSELLARVFAVDVLRCPACGSRRRWISAITEAEVIERILSHLGIDTEPPIPAPARPPPQEPLPF